MIASGDQSGDIERRRALPINRWYRALCVLLGLGGLGAGGTAVFVTDVEAGPVALIAAGTLLLLLGAGGRMPTRLKIGESEAEWQQEVEIVARIARTVPEVDALLTESGASFDAILAGRRLEPSTELAEAGVRVGQLSADIELLKSISAPSSVPTSALIEVARWYLAQHDWAEAVRYLDAYIARVQPTWRDYFSLGVANANLRGGTATDRAALRAYNLAAALMPDGEASGLIPRLFSYRAGVKKRLGRYKEAKADASLARELAERKYDLIDATYNLACAEIGLNEREAAIRHVEELVELGGRDLVLGHLDDYFQPVLGDPAFRRAIGLRSE